ncbi:hypothetical protein ES705_40889 [subsurface metagenome]
MSEQRQEIKVSFPEHLKGGVYCNNLFITHTKEEFIMDFLMVAPPEGAVTARVIMNPGHIKRVLTALQTNVQRYEDKFGKITEATEPKSKLGFHTE